MGYTSTTAQLFTVAPNMTGFLVVIATAHFSDKVKNRGVFIVGGTVLGICGYVMLLVSDANPVKYAGTFFIAAGVFQASPMLMVSLNLLPPACLVQKIVQLFCFGVFEMTCRSIPILVDMEHDFRRRKLVETRANRYEQGWVANNLSPHYVRAVGVGVVISLANCSAFIGTFIYIQRDA